MDGSLFTAPDKQLTLLLNLSSSPQEISQRKLALETGISIGSVNASIRELIRNGYIGSKSVNRKKKQYFLTPKGTELALKRAHQLVVQAIEHYQSIESRMGALIKERKISENGDNSSEDL